MWNVTTEEFNLISGRSSPRSPGSCDSFAEREHVWISAGPLHPPTLKEPSLLEAQSSHQRLDLQVHIFEPNQFALKIWTKLRFVSKFGFF